VEFTVGLLPGFSRSGNGKCPPICLDPRPGSGIRSGASSSPKQPPLAGLGRRRPPAALPVPSGRGSHRSARAGSPIRIATGPGPARATPSGDPRIPAGLGVDRPEAGSPTATAFELGSQLRGGRSSPDLRRNQPAPVRTRELTRWPLPAQCNGACGDWARISPRSTSAVFSPASRADAPLRC
jgi:hypothetical protein